MSDIKNITKYTQEKQEQQLSIHSEILFGDEKYTFSHREVPNTPLSMHLPESLILMSNASIKLKYPSVERPKIILTTINETVNFLYTPTEIEFPSTELKTTMEGFRAVLKRMNPSFVINEPQPLQTTQDKEIYWFDYRSPVMETELYNLMYATEVNGTLFMGGFNCLWKYRFQWKTLILQMMRTITVKETTDAESSLA